MKSKLFLTLDDAVKVAVYHFGADPVIAKQEFEQKCYLPGHDYKNGVYDGLQLAENSNAKAQNSNQETQKSNGDLIYRADAIDAVRKCVIQDVGDWAMLVDKAEAIIALNALPSAEPKTGKRRRKNEKQTNRV